MTERYTRPFAVFCYDHISHFIGRLVAKILCKNSEITVYQSNFLFFLIMEYCFHFSTSAMKYQIHNFAPIMLNFLTYLIGATLFRPYETEEE
jgi:hypothetical protein